MKKFTNVWMWMMVLLLSSSVLVAQTQQKVSADRAPAKKELNDDQLKVLEKAGFSTAILKTETMTDEAYSAAKKLLNELDGAMDSNPGVKKSSSYIEKTKNPDASVTVTLGTGTSTNTTTGNPTPYGTYYKNFRQQYLILAGELTSLGIGPGDITALGFNVAALNTCVDMPGFTISMKQTPLTVLTTTFDNEGYSTVFYLDTFLPIEGWNTHTFDTPFTWDGTSNLIIDICTTLIPGAYTQNASVYYTPTTGTNTCLRYQSDTQPACLTTTAGTVSVNRANMQITGEELLNPPPGIPYNEMPITGTIDVAIDGDLTWTFGANTDTYDLWLGPSGALVKVVDNQPAGATGTYTYSGLSFATGYQWQVVATNANGSTNGPVWNFSTACGSITAFPWTEGFEGATIPALPSCWLEENGDWVTTNNASSTYDADAYTGTQFLRDSWNATNEYVWTPGFALEAGIPYDFSFWWAGDNYAGWTGDVFYNTSQSSVGATQLGIPFVEAATTTTKTYAHVTNTFAPTEAGTYYFAIRVNCPTSSPWYLSFDDFRFEPSPSCPQPMTLGATYIADESADLTWISFSGLSDVEFGFAGFIPTGTPTYSGVVSPYTVTGLTALTAYSFYVRDDCGGGDLSFWAGPYTFTTQPSCPQPFDLGASNVTMTSADLTWTSFSGFSDIEFGVGGFTPTGVPTYSGIVSPYNVSGLNSASPYDFYVRDDCGGGDYSFWSGPFTLLTSPGSQTLPVWEDFENGFVYFNNAAGNQVDWTINNMYYHSGAQCAHNSYNNTQTNILHETGVLDLSSAAVVWLDFWQIAKAEGNYDHCIVEISTDGGLTYTPLPLETYAGSGNYHVPTANAPYEICFDEDSYAIWGTGSEIPDNATWWQHEIFDLSNYLTTNVRIRFRIHTDGSVVRYGWLLDEILIFEPAYGTVSGTVTELATSNPVEGATISIGSLNTVTAADGTYNFPAVLTGTWTANCFKTGYNPAAESVTIVEDQNTVQDFALTAPVFVVSPLVMTQTIDPNGTAQQTLNLSNTGNGEVDWNASISILSDNKSDGEVKGSQAYAVQIYPDPTGVVSFDTDIPGTFTTISSTALDPFAGDFSAASNTLLYIITYTSSTLYSVDITTGAETMIAPVTGVTSGHNVSGMACDKTSGIMYVSSTNISASDIYTIDLTTGVLTNIGATGIPGVIEIAIDGTGTMYAWDIVNDQSFTIDKTTAASTLLGALGYDLNYAQGGNWDPLTDEIFVAAYSTSGQLMTLDKTTGGLTFIGDFSGGAEVDALAFPGSLDTWLSIDVQAGTLEAGNTGQITVNFDATDLLPGVYEAEIHFNTAPNVGSPVVDVTMTVEGLIPAINLSATHSCTDVELTWDMPAGGNPDSWNVYRDGTLLGNSTVMSHTDEMVMTNVEFSYYVKAVYAGEESMPSTPETITVPTPGSLQPIGLSAVANSPSQNYVTLEWNEPNACLEPDGYDIYRDNVKINTSLVTELTYVDGPLSSGLYEFKLKAVYYFGESGFSTPAYALIPVGIDENGDEQFRIYPNPVSNLINIESDFEITRIIMYNNSGQIVMDKEINSYNCQINVSQFDKGSYIISLETGITKSNRKITIN